MQHKLSKGPLLDDKGNLIEAGYSFSLDKEYDRKAIKGLKGRIKEWDYYYIGDENYGIALTIDDNSYMGLVSVSVLDYKSKQDKNSFSLKRLNLSGNLLDYVPIPKRLGINFINVKLESKMIR